MTEYHFCVHNTLETSTYNTNDSIQTLDTSSYCCVPKPLARISIKKDNASLYNRHCKERSLNQKHIILFATIISSYEPLSKRCYDRKNPITRHILPTPEFPFSTDEEPIEEKDRGDFSRPETIIHEDKPKLDSNIQSSLIVEEDENSDKYQNKKNEKVQLINKAQTDEVRISIWVPEKIIYQDKTKLDKNITLVQKIETEEINRSTVNENQPNSNNQQMYNNQDYAQETDPAMRVGDVTFLEDKDFFHFKNECISDDGWNVCYDKSTCRVSTKKNSLSNFDVIRVQSEYSNISAELLYDVIHDGDYRPTWDTAMLEGYELCAVTHNSDIGYYSMKSPPPFSNRDFVTQRSWLDWGHNHEKIIINHSVNHLREPPRKNCVRGISYLTGYLLVPMGPSSCKFYYMTQSDPGGNLPAWVVNRASKVFVPKLMKRLAKACSKYEKWKAKNKPSFKPWLFPEQMNVGNYNPADVGQLDTKETLTASANNNEAAVQENSVQDSNLEQDD
ncbi:unnamed protein product [Rotaria magnacalcarata]|uniref:START domain-containing protein 10 n=2 Tax=Rotaria magnacalcarata TaxID=392030 RepID=A0A8S2QJ07_9BILA|nr:unnamed protein product [Rotaria magnacalcarata]CAF4177691.1 unnamed protein product [Rotaria magnacalcarata]